MDKGIDIDTILADMDAALEIPPEIDDGEIPIKIFVEHWDTNNHTALKRLRKMERQGKGTLRIVRLANAAKSWAWRPKA